jgi:starch synthase
MANYLNRQYLTAHFVNTVSPTFLKEIVEGRHGFVKSSLHRELTNKSNAGCALGILNFPDPSYNPSTDEALTCTYSATNPMLSAKKHNLLKI